MTKVYCYWGIKDGNISSLPACVFCSLVHTEFGIEYVVALTLHCESDVHNAAQLYGSNYKEIAPYPNAPEMYDILVSQAKSRFLQHMKKPG